MCKNDRILHLKNKLYISIFPDRSATCRVARARLVEVHHDVDEGEN